MQLMLQKITTNITKSKTTIVPIPKKNKITCLNDWKPVALTPIFSKCFEKLIRDYICSVLPASLDPLQFAYRSNRSTDDAIAEEVTSTPLLPETAEEVWNEPQHPEIILHLHCGEHPDRLHHHLVWKQHRWQPQSSAKGCANCPPDCWR